jgi:hypothetical protein
MLIFSLFAFSLLRLIVQPSREMQRWLLDWPFFPAPPGVVFRVFLGVALRSPEKLPVAAFRESAMNRVPGVKHPGEVVHDVPLGAPSPGVPLCGGGGDRSS